MTQSILVTGGAGYIGSICVEILIQAGYRVTVFDNLSEGHQDAIATEANFFLGDLGKMDDIMDAFDRYQPSAVIHFAASALVGESMENPGKYFQNNVTSGINLLQAMLAQGINKIVFSSSCAIFGHSDVMPVHEDIAKNPVNPYGESKLMFEKILHWYNKIHGIQFTILRYFNVIGATEKRGEHHHHETHLIPNILQVALGKRDTVNIYGNDYPTPDGTCIRDYIHVSDLSKAHLLALEKMNNQSYNIGIGDGASVQSVVECCRSITQQNIPTTICARRSGDPAVLVASPKKVMRELGWKPYHTNIKSMIETAWSWHLKYPHGYV